MATKLQNAQEMYDLWKNAYIALASGQEYSISTGGSSRTLKRGDIETVRKQMEYWEQRVSDLQGGTRRRKFIVPVDY